MKRRRELTPAQRVAKNERDRRRRREHKVEFERRKKSEADLRASLERLRNEITESRENEERLKSEVSKLMNIIHQQHQEILERQVNSWVDLDNFPSPNEEVANNEPSTQCPGSSQSAIQDADAVNAKCCSTFKAAAPQQTKPTQ